MRRIVKGFLRNPKFDLKCGLVLEVDPVHKDSNYTRKGAEKEREYQERAAAGGAATD